MNPVSPVIRGHKHEEICWAKQWQGLSIIALPVNPADGCDNIVLRYKLTFRERVAIFLGQDLFVWLSTYRNPMDNSVRFPKLFAENPRQLANGDFIPNEDFRLDVAYTRARGAIVDSKTADGQPSFRNERFVEAEFAKTVKEKIEERDAIYGDLPPRHPEQP